jgi:hypothetical protein
MSVTAQKRREQLPDYEELLVDYAERLRKHLPGRRAVHIHLSKLKPHNRREHHIRIAASSFNGLVQRHEGQIFMLKNCDLVVVLKNAKSGELDETLLRLRYLFSEDPLAHDNEGESEQPFCTWYDLEKEYEDFCGTAYELRRQAQAQRRAAAAAEQAAALDAGAPATQPLDPTRLGRLEVTLASTDLAGIVRRQAVCAITGPDRPRPVFNEIFVSIDELRRRLMPEVNLASDRWLFQRLTVALDRRLLKALPAIEANVPLSTSVNLNVSTVLSEEFLAFDRELRARTPKSMVVEFQPIDVFADLGSYMFARDFARERGYKVCLDALTYLTFPIMHRDELGLDLQKIHWSADIVADAREERREALREAVRRAGPARVILCRCDDQAALDFGRSIGVSLFQGRHVDRLVTQG